MSDGRAKVTGTNGLEWKACAMSVSHCAGVWFSMNMIMHAWIWSMNQ